MTTQQAPIHRGIDGALVNLTRDPLQAQTLQRIAEIRDVTGWLPTRVTRWFKTKWCPTCKIHYLYDGDWCPRHAATLLQESRDERHVCYTTWWKPWTWSRPSLVEVRNAGPAVDIEVIPPAPDNGPTTGRLTLVTREKDPA